MNGAALQRRLAQIEGQLAALVPAPSGLEEALAWARRASDDELEWLEQLASRCAHLDHEPTPQEQARWLAIESACIVRMLAGEPDVIEQGRREREADVLEQRRRGKALWLGFDPRTDPVYEGPPGATASSHQGCWNNAWAQRVSSRSYGTSVGATDPRTSAGATEPEQVVRGSTATACTTVRSPLSPLLAGSSPQDSRRDASPAERGLLARRLGYQVRV